MTELALLSYLIFGLVFVYVRLGVLAPVTFLAATNLISCTVLYWVTQQALTKFDFMAAGVYFSAMPMRNLDLVIVDTLLFYCMVTSMCMAACITVRPGAYKTIFGDRNLRVSINAIRDYLQQGRSTSSLSYALVALWALTIWHFLDLDKSVLWYNTDYLTIKEPDKVGLSSEVTAIYHHGFRLVGLLSGLIGVILVTGGRVGIGLMFLGLWLYAVGMLYIGNSRWLMIYSLSIGIAIRIFGRGFWSKAIFWTMIGVSVLAFSQVIYGRTRGIYGISVVLDQALAFHLSDIPFAIRGLLINSFEGALNVANSILIEPEFLFRYQIRSISPAISAIDGFDRIRDLDKVKFAPHVPMGAFGEVIHFVLPLQIVYFIILFTAMRATVRWEFTLSMQRYLPVAIFYIYVFYLLPTYSARTTARFVCIAFAIHMLWPSLRRLLVNASRIGGNPG